MTRREHSRGQASVEAIALVPIMVVCVLLCWQLAVLVRGALIAHDQVRASGIPATGTGTLDVRATVKVPTLLPGVGTLTIPARGVVRAP